MIKTLYEQFRPWSLFGSVYIISDPHFMDYDMNWRIRDVPTFMNLPEDEESVARTIAYHIVDTINSVCHQNDTLIVLGDIGDVEWMTKLKAGHRVLIAGNHDVGMSKYKNRSGKHYFDEVYNGPLFIAKNILLSHEPINGPWVNYHGHKHRVDYPYYRSHHEYDLVFELDYDWLGINCVCESNAFYPINLKKSIEEGGFSKFNDIHRITIDKASKNKLSENSLY